MTRERHVEGIYHKPAKASGNRLPCALCGDPVYRKHGVTVRGERYCRKHFSDPNDSRRGRRS